MSFKLKQLTADQSFELSILVNIRHFLCSSIFYSRSILLHLKKNADPQLKQSNKHRNAVEFA